MSVYQIYFKDRDKKGPKYMRPIRSRREYLAIRNGGQQISNVARVRAGEEHLKFDLEQMNYSCMPNDDGGLKGTKHITTTVGMDIDHVPAAEMQPMKERILAKKNELGLKMLEKSARGEGYHLVFGRRTELSQEQNLKWASTLLGVAFDKQAKDITRVFFTTTGSAEDLIYLDDSIFEIEEAPVVLDNAADKPSLKVSDKPSDISQNQAISVPTCPATPQDLAAFDLCVELAGLKAGEMDLWGEHNWHNNLMAVLSVGVGKLMGRMELLSVVAQRLPNYSKTEDCRKLIDYFYEKYDASKGFMNADLREINAKAQKKADAEWETDDADDDAQSSEATPQLPIKKMPQGIRDSIDALGPQMAMPIVTAICPCIGALATGVILDVHGHKKNLNLISYIAGDYASGKGDIDPVIEAWMSEVQAVDDMYINSEDEFRAKVRASRNQKNQPEEVNLPVRCVALNNTVANLAERLANVEGKHAFSFTPEADTVAQKFKSTMCDFSVMLRQGYDGSKYDREAKSADAVNVHIKHLLWNVTMCGTPDAIYRVVTNYTDGLQSRIAIAQTPDNTYAKLGDKNFELTARQTERIQQVAHLLPLMQGTVVLPKLEAEGRKWLEKIRLEAMKNDDRVKARQRIRICVTTQRMVCCLMLCKVCEQLIQKHGLAGAENLLKRKPALWREMLIKAQTPVLLDTYEVIADSLLDKALLFFRDRIENAVKSRNYVSNQNSERQKRGKNDTIYERLDPQFTFDQAKRHSIALKGADVTHNSVRQMLKNWRKQGLVVLTEDGSYRKVS